MTSVLNHIHCVQGNILRRTDNGSNFIKPFKVFGVDEDNNAAKRDGDSSQPGEDEEGQVWGDEVEFLTCRRF